MRRALASVILILAFIAAAPSAHAFSLLDPSTWTFPQYDWNSFKIQDPNSWPFIPVPEVATDPNGGVTYGVLPVWLFTDNKNEISGILAPDINANKIVTSTPNCAKNPSTRAFIAVTSIPEPSPCP